MALVECKDCKKEFSTDAKACPNCGAKKPSKASGGAIALAMFFLFIVFMAGIEGQKPEPALSPEQEQYQNDVAEARQYFAMIKQASRNPEKFVAEQALMMENRTLCLVFRAENGFGGMNQTGAVITADRTKVKLEGDKGFVSLYNKECSDKTGNDVTPSYIP